MKDFGDELLTLQSEIAKVSASVGKLVTKNPDPTGWTGREMQKDKEEVETLCTRIGTLEEEFEEVCNRLGNQIGRLRGILRVFEECREEGE